MTSTGLHVPALGQAHKVCAGLNMFVSTQSSPMQKPTCLKQLIATVPNHKTSAIFCPL